VQTQAPRTIRIRTLRRLEQRLDRSIDQLSRTGTSTRELANLSVELDRQLSRLEQMPWPSSRTFAVQHDDRATERKLVPLLRAARSSQTYSPAGKL
jgi:hypothetical protein